jgi:DNA-binding response OmpR family regulator
MRILLVEDDSPTAEFLVSTLAWQSHVVDVAPSAEHGEALLRVFPYDLVLLDIGLPKLDGISFCRQLRQQNSSILIMLLTAKSDPASCVLGLDAGADDCLIKPIHSEELAARLRALQRRGSSSSPVLEVGELRLDPVRKEITYANQVLNFRPKEYTLLELLLRHPQRVFSRCEILDRLWTAEDEAPGESTVKAHIRGIRQVLRTVGAEELVRTSYGQGYCLDPSFCLSPTSHPSLHPSLLEETGSIRPLDTQTQSTVKVLAIEEDTALSNLLQDLMLPFGVEMISLSSPKRLWRTLFHVQPDLILLDLSMSEINSIDLCKSIRRSHQWQWLPIVILAVGQDLDTQIQVFEVGADDYLWRPFAPSVLATRILNRISRFKAVQQRALSTFCYLQKSVTIAQS